MHHDLNMQFVQSADLVWLWLILCRNHCSILKEMNEGGVQERNNSAGIFTTTFKTRIVHTWTGDKCLILQGKNPIVMPQSKGPSERSDTQKNKRKQSKAGTKKGDGGDGDGGYRAREELVAVNICHDFVNITSLPDLQQFDKQNRYHQNGFLRLIISPIYLKSTVTGLLNVLCSLEHSTFSKCKSLCL